MRLLILGIALSAGLSASAQSGPEIKPEQLDVLHALLKPEPGRQHLWMEIPWLIGIHEAREKAVRENKPLLLWRAANGHPLGHS